MKRGISKLSLKGLSNVSLRRLIPGRDQTKKLENLRGRNVGKLKKNLPTLIVHMSPLPPRLYLSFVSARLALSISSSSWLPIRSAAVMNSDCWIISFIPSAR